MTSVVWKPNGEKCPHTNVVNGNGVRVWYRDDGGERCSHHLPGRQERQAFDLVVRERAEKKQWFPY
ncbi:MAG: hypothetical protein O3B25_09025 [Verrucomicrobia bacterium]|nr:hypothetical protein [Verrucomicrobiota bacterium]